MALSMFASAAFAAEDDKAWQEARMQWWSEARFGLFIHWGIYSVPAGVYKGKQIGWLGEWIMNSAKIPVAEYAKYASQFNPVKFNAEEWVKMAKDAGMKYIVITAKHHDGFAMFRSKVSPFNIYDATPFKRDPLKELSRACRAQGMKLCFYYSQAQDWHHAGGVAAGDRWDKAQEGSMDKYLTEIAAPQVGELLANYGPRVPGVLWWDTPNDMTKERAEMLLPQLKLKPFIITNDRLGGGFAGDFDTPEQTIPAAGNKDRAWETCMTMNDTWGYKSNDTNWKSTTTLVRDLVDIASKGGNYLLNVGPTAKGEFPKESVKRLKEIGRWMEKNGKAIHGTTASPFANLSFNGRCTRRGDALYIHVFEWPSEGVKLSGLVTPIGSATFLKDGSKAEYTRAGDAEGAPILTIMPPAVKDSIDTVVELLLAGPLEVMPSK
jgi:alpha-L-fucosidase